PGVGEAVGGSGEGGGGRGGGAGGGGVGAAAGGGAGDGRRDVTAVGGERHVRREDAGRRRREAHHHGYGRLGASVERAAGDDGERRIHGDAAGENPSAGVLDGEGPVSRAPRGHRPEILRGWRHGQHGRSLVLAEQDAQREVDLDPGFGGAPSRARVGDRQPRAGEGLEDVVDARRRRGLLQDGPG